jgi:hypothetical protein
VEEPQPGDALNLIKKFLRRACTHRFTWPRMDASGRYYQVCLACGTAYEYDWELMRQTGKVLNDTLQHHQSA